MSSLIVPILHSLSTTVRVPGSKSLTNRALLISALADGKTRIVNALFSDDSLYFAHALQKLGFDVQLSEADREMTVNGLGGRIPSHQAELFVGNAGTAARFLSAFLTLGQGEYVLDGDARMRERPIGDLIDALKQLGAELEPLKHDDLGRPGDASLPIRIKADGLRGGKAAIAGDISSQFLSALLMTAPYAKHPVDVELSTGLNSKPYIDMTIAIMADFGVPVDHRGYERFSVKPAAYSPQPVYSIESDASAASYFFAAPAICGGTVLVRDISRKSKQGDTAFLDVLVRMGCSANEKSLGIEVTGRTPLQGIDVDMSDIPDTAQTLAVVAPFANSPTRIRGIASARVKETDRVHATCTELSRLGVHVEEHEDGMIIHPCETFSPAVVRTYNDHRMAMAFSLIGLKVSGVEIENPRCVSKTFPNFFDVLDSLR